MQQQGRLRTMKEIRNDHHEVGTGEPLPPSRKRLLLHPNRRDRLRRRGYPHASAGVDDRDGSTSSDSGRLVDLGGLLSMLMMVLVVRLVSGVGSRRLESLRKCEGRRHLLDGLRLVLERRR